MVTQQWCETKCQKLTPCKNVCQSHTKCQSIGVSPSSPASSQGFFSQSLFKSVYKTFRSVTRPQVRNYSFKSKFARSGTLAAFDLLSLKNEFLQGCEITPSPRYRCTRANLLYPVFNEFLEFKKLVAEKKDSGVHREEGQRRQLYVRLFKLCGLAFKVFRRV